MRRRNERILETLPHWFISSKGILIGCILAHSGAQSGSHAIANDHGIIIADSRDIAEILALHKKWNLAEKDKGVTDFLRNGINNTISGTRKTF
ncbi:MAG: hypothetical protein GY795_06705 [Desulfobacterales bacterium]|nr:hypothetical protein [Desulfobacterales bacterium]